MPLKVSGRHYGENLARLDLLFSSLLEFAPGLLDELLIVVRADEADQIGRHLSGWSELPIRLVLEDEHFPAFRRYTRPWQVRPWQRQQLIKLNAPAMTDASFVLTLDPDVLAPQADHARAARARRPGAHRARAAVRAPPLVARFGRPARRRSPSSSGPE